MAKRAKIRNALIGSFLAAVLGCGVWLPAAAAAYRDKPLTVQRTALPTPAEEEPPQSVEEIRAVTNSRHCPSASAKKFVRLVRQDVARCNSWPTIYRPVVQSIAVNGPFLPSGAKRPIRC